MIHLALWIASFLFLAALALWLIAAVGGWLSSLLLK